MSIERREKARHLRQQGMSIRQIAETVGASRGSISLWVRDIRLTEDQEEKLRQNQQRWAAQNTGAQVNRSRARTQRLKFQEVGRAAAREGSPLHLIGCMLYWAEGAKSRNEIYLVNSDVNMLRLFMRFLREELNVDDLLVTVHIHCHTDEVDEKQRIGAYWLSELNLPESCLRKIQTKEGSQTRHNRLENGVCGIRVCRTELVHHIYGAIQEYGSFDNPDWLF
jgi:transcriptional regulator with XRE-family HTH domain